MSFVPSKLVECSLVKKNESKWPLLNLEYLQATSSIIPRILMLTSFFICSNATYIIAATYARIDNTMNARVAWSLPD